MRTCGVQPRAKPETSRFPYKERPHMPGSSTTSGRTGTRDDAPAVLPSVIMTTSAPGLFQAFAAQWLAYVPPYRRFAVTLAGANARLGADADRYSFIAVDLHHLLPAGFERRTKNLDF
jgi:hypothetical protein